MKNIIAIALLAASAAFGQIALTQTTLASAVTQTADPRSTSRTLMRRAANWSRCRV